MSKKPARVFQHCDLLISTSDDGVTDIMANARGRAAIDAIINIPIDWEFGGSQRDAESIGAPLDWRIACLSLAELERDGYATRVPKIETIKGGSAEFAISSRWALAAKLYAASLRTVIHDDRLGYNLVEMKGDKLVTHVIDFDRWKGRH